MKYLYLEWDFDQVVARVIVIEQIPILAGRVAVKQMQVNLRASENGWK